MAIEDQKYFAKRKFLFAGLTLLIAAVAVFVAWDRGEPPRETSAPTAVADSEPAAGIPSTAQSDLTLPSFDVVRISRGGTGVIAGRAAPGAEVDILSGSEIIGSVVAGGSGEWVWIITEPLPPGPAELSLRTARVDGNFLESANVVVLSVPERPEERFVESDSDGVVALLSPRNGVGPSRVLQRPGSVTTETANAILGIDTLDYGNAGEVIVSGRAASIARLAVYIDNDFIGTATAGEGGRWTLTAEADLSAGAHILRADQVLEAGNVELRVEQLFDMGQPLDPAESRSTVNVRPGNNLWHIARLVYGTGFRYTLIFQENADQIRDPNLIYPNQRFTLPKPSQSADGSVP